MELSAFGSGCVEFPLEPGDCFSIRVAPVRCYVEGAEVRVTKFGFKDSEERLGGEFFF